MKKLLVALALVIGVAHAGEITVKSISQYELWGSASVSQTFAVNPELGRAWVEVSISSNDPEGGAADVERIKVPGLTFDSATGNINLDFEGKITTCAVQKTVGRSIFRQKVIKSTGCKFEGRWRTVTYDDGFEIKTTKRYDVVLVVLE